MKNTHLKELAEKIKAPEFILPWLDRFYDPKEIRMIRAYPWGSDKGENFFEIFYPDSMDRFVRRQVLAEDEKGSFAPADFHARYDIWALFEGFKDIPRDIREQLNRWELDHYIRSHKKEVENIRRTGILDPSRILPRYLLLDEALDVLDRAGKVFLWPCNCRSMMEGCKQSVYTCLRFDNSQGQGYEISLEKAKQIIMQANKNGLMQSGELGWDQEGSLMGAICNCCPDCCFPHQLARELKAQKIWPKSRYIARWNEADCSFCGLCAKRCPFQAFIYDKEKKDKTTRLNFTEQLCRGCGLCAVTCPVNAIQMEEIE